ncbi:unnamed protein product [Phytomonas sp. EM1]|nr:unnamed protein product [Phytomonas sp. EM1]|eukprot:CCW62123.1 unnamed protein product [Phytomonas sp. isolate EM1]
MLIPFVGLYVSFMMNWSPEKAGYTAGCLVGLFMLGQVISGKHWGYISETFGRKFAIVIGVTCCAVSMFFFGLCSNIYMCAFWRLAHGIMAGCSLAAKAVIADVTDYTNQSSGFALVSLTWGVGTLIGPTVGGLFYDPAHQGWLSFLSWNKKGFWAMHPAFLPSLIAATYNSVAIVVCVLFLEETNKDAKPLRTKLPSKIETPLRPYFRYLQPKVIVEKDPLMNSTRATGAVVVDPDLPDPTVTKEDHTEHGFSITLALNKLANDFFHRAYPLAETGDGRRNDADCTKSVVIHGEEDTFDHPSDEILEMLSMESLDRNAKRKSFGYKQAFSHPLTRGVCIIAMLICGSDMIFAEVFPLWTIAPRKNGGLNLSSGNVGLLILVNSVPAVISNVYFSKVLSLFQNPMVFWSLSQTAYGSINLLFPFVINLSETNAFWCTMALGLVRKALESWTFATLMLVVARSAPQGYVSIMYGIQQSVSCIVRCIVPFTFAPLFAWSISEPHVFPFNHHFTFTLSLIPLLVSAVFTLKLKLPDPPTEDNKNIVEQSHQENLDHAADAPKHEKEVPEQVAQPISWVAELYGDEGNNLLANNSFVVLSSSFANPVDGILSRSATVADVAIDGESSDLLSNFQVSDRENGFVDRKHFFTAESTTNGGSIEVNHRALFDERDPGSDTSKTSGTSSGDITNRTESMITCIFPPTNRLSTNHVHQEDTCKPADELSNPD